jgi:hypothetical protein
VLGSDSLDLGALQRIVSSRRDQWNVPGPFDKIIVRHKGRGETAQSKIFPRYVFFINALYSKWNLTSLLDDKPFLFPVVQVLVSVK